MYLILEQTTSMTGPSAPPTRCTSLQMKSCTFCTFFLCFQRRDSTSHLSGVATMMFPFASSFRSVAVSPVSSTVLMPSPENLLCQRA